MHTFRLLGIYNGVILYQIVVLHGSICLRKPIIIVNNRIRSNLQASELPCFRHQRRLSLPRRRLIHLKLRKPALILQKPFQITRLVFNLKSIGSSSILVM